MDEVSTKDRAGIGDENFSADGRAIIWDLFGVLLRFQTRQDYERLAATVGVDPVQLWPHYRGRNRFLYDAGLLTPKEYWERIGEDTGIVIDWRAACAAEYASWSGRIEPTVAYLHELHRDGVPMALLSNLPPDFVEMVLEREPWIEDICEPRVFSGHVNLAKPSSEIFEVVLRKLAGRLGVDVVDPARVLFIDDSPENVRAAESLGLVAHHFGARDPECRDASGGENDSSGEAACDSLRLAVCHFLSV